MGIWVDRIQRPSIILYRNNSMNQLTYLPYFLLYSFPLQWYVRFDQTKSLYTIYHLGKQPLFYVNTWS